MKRAAADFQSQMQHGAQAIPTVLPVRPKQLEAAFKHRRQFGTPIDKPARLKQQEATFQERMRHGKPRHAPPHVPAPGATWKRNPTIRGKEGESLFRSKQPPKIPTMAELFRSKPRPPAQIAKQSTARHARPTQLGGSNTTETLLLKMSEQLGQMVALLERSANEGQQRDTGQLPPKEETTQSHSDVGSHILRAASAATSGGSDPLGAIVKEGIRTAVRVGIEALMA